MKDFEKFIKELIENKVQSLPGVQGNNQNLRKVFNIGDYRIPSVSTVIDQRFDRINNRYIIIIPISGYSEWILVSPTGTYDSEVGKIFDDVVQFEYDAKEKTYEKIGHEKLDYLHRSLEKLKDRLNAYLDNHFSIA